MKNKKVYVVLIVLILIGSIFLTYNIYQNRNKVMGDNFRTTLYFRRNKRTARRR